MKQRVFRDLLNDDVIVYLKGSRDAGNFSDIVELFEVNGLNLAITVSGDVADELERMRREAVSGNDGHRFYTEAERTEKTAIYNQNWKHIRETVAGMVYDAYRKETET